jgi:hypothetical protein
MKPVRNYEKIMPASATRIAINHTFLSQAITFPPSSGWIGSKLKKASQKFILAPKMKRSPRATELKNKNKIPITKLVIGPDKAIRPISVDVKGIVGQPHLAKRCGWMTTAPGAAKIKPKKGERIVMRIPSGHMR